MPNPLPQESREGGARLLAGGLWLLDGVLLPPAPSLPHGLSTHAPAVGKLRQQLPSHHGYRRDEVPASVQGHGAAGALDQLLPGAQPSACGHPGFAARGGGEGDPGKNFQPVKQTEPPLRETPSPFSSLQWKRLVAWQTPLQEVVTRASLGYLGGGKGNGGVGFAAESPAARCLAGCRGQPGTSPPRHAQQPAGRDGDTGWPLAQELQE